jgi:hypothetical protein
MHSDLPKLLQNPPIVILCTFRFANQMHHLALKYIPYLNPPKLLCNFQIVVFLILALSK